MKLGTTKHVLGLSGGRDSAALAVYMRQHHPELEIEYFFTDTGKELPEVYEYLGRLEGFLGQPILRLNPDRDFDFWLKQYNDFLPSPQTRWCTRQLKLRPFERWLRPMLEEGTTIYSYVAIRSDEEYREGYSSKHDSLIVKLPFKEAGVDKSGVLEILDGAGLGLPKYYSWRTRSGCTFCFFQQKIEWVRDSRSSTRKRSKRPKLMKRARSNMGHPLPGAKENHWKSWNGPSVPLRSEPTMRHVLSVCNQRSSPIPCGRTTSRWTSMICMGSRKVCLACHK